MKPERRTFQNPLSRLLGPLSLRKKLVLLISTISVVVVSLSILASFFIELNSFKQRLLNEYIATTRTIGGNAQAAIEFREPYDAADILYVLNQRQHIQTASIYLADGTVLATYRAPNIPSNQTPPALDAQTSISGKSIIVAEPVIDGTIQIGTVTLEANVGEVRSFLLQRIWMLVALLALSTSLATYLAASIGRKITQPVLDLAHTAERISKEKDYSTRQEVTNNDEVGKLVAAFNRMMAEVQIRDEQINEEKERAEASSKAKEEFLSVISHELRTPLNPILGYVDVLLRKNQSEEDKKQLSLIKIYAEHLQGLIDDVLDYSRIERGVFALNKEGVDYQELCESTLELLRPKALNQSVGLSIVHEQVPPSDNPPHYVKIDKLRIQQVLLNLVSNALKFTKSGSVRIHTLLDMSATPSPTLRVSVVDTGIGIAPEDRDKVFEPFKQIQATLTREHSGLGLGLAITRKIVDALSGTIDFESKPGEGSKFWFEIPVETINRPQFFDTAIEVRETASLPRTGRILLVDDQLVNRELGESLLQECGHEVVCAANGFEALDLFKEDRFDLVFMDIRMPRKDGYETAREMRAMESPEHRTPIVALTAHITARTDENERHSEMDDILSKPISQEKINSVLKRWLKE